MAGHSKYKNIMYREGRAGQETVRALLQAQPRDHRRGEDGATRSGGQCAAARGRHRCSRPVDAKDNIQRSIDKAAGGDADNYEEIRYEGFGPGGVAIIVEALSDNRNRTATNVRTAFSKNGGTWAPAAASVTASSGLA